MACKKAGEAATKNGIAELAKRVPPNQTLKFKDFQAKHAEYRARVSRQPEKLPNIDWEYYKRYVRADFVKMVGEFEQKYKGLCEAFDNRHLQDKSKYFQEIDRLKQQVQEDVEKYKAASNERIKALEANYARIESLIPYEEMTAEEYADLLPEKSFFKYKGEPSFWPHTPDEQGPGPSVKHAHGHGDDGGHGSEGGSPGGSTDGVGGGGAGGSTEAAVKRAHHSEATAKTEPIATPPSTPAKTDAQKLVNSGLDVACFESQQFKRDLESLQKCFEDSTQKSDNDRKAAAENLRVEVINPFSDKNADIASDGKEETMPVKSKHKIMYKQALSEIKGEECSSAENEKTVLQNISKADLPDLAKHLEEMTSKAEVCFADDRTIVAAAKDEESTSKDENLKNSTAVFMPVVPKRSYNAKADDSSKAAESRILTATNENVNSKVDQIPTLLKSTARISVTNANAVVKNDVISNTIKTKMIESAGSVNATESILVSTSESMEVIEPASIKSTDNLEGITTTATFLEVEPFQTVSTIASNVSNTRKNSKIVSDFEKPFKSFEAVAQKNNSQESGPEKIAPKIIQKASGAIPKVLSKDIQSNSQKDNETICLDYTQTSDRLSKSASSKTESITIIRKKEEPEVKVVSPNAFERNKVTDLKSPSVKIKADAAEQRETKFQAHVATGTPTAVDQVNQKSKHEESKISTSNSFTATTPEKAFTVAKQPNLDSLENLQKLSNEKINPNIAKEATQISFTTKPKIDSIISVKQPNIENLKDVQKGIISSIEKLQSTGGTELKKEVLSDIKERQNVAPKAEQPKQILKVFANAQYKTSNTSPKVTESILAVAPKEKFANGPTEKTILKVESQEIQKTASSLIKNISKTLNSKIEKPFESKKSDLKAAAVERSQKLSKSHEGIPKETVLKTVTPVENASKIAESIPVKARDHNGESNESSPKLAESILINAAVLAALQQTSQESLPKAEPLPSRPETKAFIEIISRIARTLETDIKETKSASNLNQSLKPTETNLEAARSILEKALEGAGLKKKAQETTDPKGDISKKSSHQQILKAETVEAHKKNEAFHSVKAVDRNQETVKIVTPTNISESVQPIKVSSNKEASNSVCVQPDAILTKISKETISTVESSEVSPKVAKPDSNRTASLNISLETKPKEDDSVLVSASIDAALKKPSAPAIFQIKQIAKIQKNDISLNENKEKEISKTELAEKSQKAIELSSGSTLNKANLDKPNDSVKPKLDFATLKKPGEASVLEDKPCATIQAILKTNLPNETVPIILKDTSQETTPKVEPIKTISKVADSVEAPLKKTSEGKTQKFDSDESNTQTAKSILIGAACTVALKEPQLMEKVTNEENNKLTLISSTKIAPNELGIKTGELKKPEPILSSFQTKVQTRTESENINSTSSLNASARKELIQTSTKASETFTKTSENTAIKNTEANTSNLSLPGRVQEKDACSIEKIKPIDVISPKIDSVQIASSNDLKAKAVSSCIQCELKSLASLNKVASMKNKAIQLNIKHSEATTENSGNKMNEQCKLASQPEKSTRNIEIDFSDTPKAKDIAAKFDSKTAQILKPTNEIFNSEGSKTKKVSFTEINVKASKDSKIVISGLEKESVQTSLQSQKIAPPEIGSKSQKQTSKALMKIDANKIANKVDFIEKVKQTEVSSPKIITLKDVEANKLYAGKDSDICAKPAPKGVISKASNTTSNIVETSKAAKISFDKLIKQADTTAPKGIYTGDVISEKKMIKGTLVNPKTETKLVIQASSTATEIDVPKSPRSKKVSFCDIIEQSEDNSLKSICVQDVKAKAVSSCIKCELKSQASLRKVNSMKNEAAQLNLMSGKSILKVAPEAAKTEDVSTQPTIQGKLKSPRERTVLDVKGNVEVSSTSPAEINAKSRAISSNEVVQQAKSNSPRNSYTKETKLRTPNFNRTLEQAAAKCITDEPTRGIKKYEETPESGQNKTLNAKKVSFGEVVQQSQLVRSKSMNLEDDKIKQTSAEKLKPIMKLKPSKEEPKPKVSVASNTSENVKKSLQQKSSSIIKQQAESPIPDIIYMENMAANKTAPNKGQIQALPKDKKIDVTKNSETVSRKKSIDTVQLAETKSPLNKFGEKVQSVLKSVKLSSISGEIIKEANVQMKSVQSILKVAEVNAATDITKNFQKNEVHSGELIRSDRDEGESFQSMENIIKPIGNSAEPEASPKIASAEKVLAKEFKPKAETTSSHHKCVPTSIKDEEFSFVNAVLKGLQVKVITSNEFFESKNADKKNDAKKESNTKKDPEQANEKPNEVSKTSPRQKKEAVQSECKTTNPVLQAGDQNIISNVKPSEATKQKLEDYCDTSASATVATTGPNDSVEPQLKQSQTVFKGFTLVGIPDTVIVKNSEAEVTRPSELLESGHIVQDRTNPLKSGSNTFSKTFQSNDPSIKLIQSKNAAKAKS